MTRRDVLIVASVSCIYGLGSPDDYRANVLLLSEGEDLDRDAALRKLVDIQYERNDVNFERGKFRVRGDTLEICGPAAVRGVSARTAIEFFGDEVERILRDRPADRASWSASTSRSTSSRPRTTSTRPSELSRRDHDDRGGAGGAPRGAREPGQAAGGAAAADAHDATTWRCCARSAYCSGIENYSRHLDGRAPGRAAVHADRLLPRGLPADRGRVARRHPADRRDVRRRPLAQDAPWSSTASACPSALDNRPLRFEEFERPHQPDAATSRRRPARSSGACAAARSSSR